MIMVNHVSKAFREHQVLNDVHLEIPKACIFGLVGPNAAGKTTLIKIMMGLFLADRGQVLIDGKDVVLNPGVKNRVGYVADHPSYYPGFQIRDMVKLYRETYSGWNEDRFDELHRVFRLPLEKKIRHLSKGMGTQLAVLLNLSIMPEVLVLDEPTSGLDPVLRRELLSILLDEVATRETTLFISSHNLGELERICDRVAIIHNGQIRFDENLGEVKKKVRKIQIAMDGDLPAEFLAQDVILKVTQQGRVYTIVVRNNLDGILTDLQKYQPYLLETVDMSLEDIFIYRMGGMDYGFEQIFA